MYAKRSSCIKSRQLKSVNFINPSGEIKFQVDITQETLHKKMNKCHMSYKCSNENTHQTHIGLHQIQVWTLSLIYLLPFLHISPLLLVYALQLRRVLSTCSFTMTFSFFGLFSRFSPRKVSGWRGETGYYKNNLIHRMRWYEIKYKTPLTETSLLHGPWTDQDRTTSPQVGTVAKTL